MSEQKKTPNAMSQTPATLSLLQNFLENTGNDWNYILPNDLRGEMSACGPSNCFVLDTRYPDDYAKGHIEGAKNIFWLDILKPESLRQLPKDKRIIVVCYVGHTASQVMTLLRLLGYDARALKFGMGKSPAVGVPVAGWENYGFKTVTTPG